MTTPEIGPRELESDSEQKLEKHDRFGASVTEFLGRVEDCQIFTFTEVKDIEYETKDGKKLSFQSLLPKGWTFVRKDREAMGSNPNGKIIIYGEHYIDINDRVVPLNELLPEEIYEDNFVRRVNPEKRLVIESRRLPQIGEKGFFLELLHEIGHAHNCEKMDPEDLLRLLEVRRRNIAKGKLTLKSDEKFSLQEQNLYEKLVIKDESCAWAWALRTFRNLRKNGIDLEPELHSLKEVLDIVHGNLLSYEDLSPKARKIFLKKFKNGNKRNTK